MTDSTAPGNLSSPRFWFYGPSGLRAGWRLLIFYTIVTALIKGENWAIPKLLPGLDDVARFLVFEIVNFLTFLFASLVMSRIEGRKIADYGLPWRQMFRGQFWLGAAMGFGALSFLLIVLRLSSSFYFGTLALHGAEILQWAFLFALVFIMVALKEEFGLRGYTLFTLSTGIGFWPAAIISSAYFGILRLRASRQLRRKLVRRISGGHIRNAGLPAPSADRQPVAADGIPHRLGLGPNLLLRRSG